MSLSSLSGRQCPPVPATQNCYPTRSCRPYTPSVTLGPFRLAFVASLSCVASTILSGCGDPMYQISVRNDSESEIVIVMRRDDGYTVAYLEDPSALGIAGSNNGDFH